MTGSLHDIGGTVNNMDYVFDMNVQFSYPPSLTFTWKNLLTRRDEIVFHGLTVGEFSGAAYYGDTAIIDTYGNLTRSFDDGSTWVAGTQVFSGQYAGDTSVAYDAHGTLYATSLTGVSTVPNYSARIVRALGSSGSWTAPVTIPGTTGIVGDRPWMSADKVRPNVLYMTWAGQDQLPDGTFLGHIAYCNGTADCDTGSAAWCGPFTLPIGVGCGGTNGPTCLVETGTDHVWILMPGDPVCTDPDREPAPYNTMYDRAVGLHEIDNTAQLDGGCLPPHYGTEHCLYFRDRIPNISQLHLEHPAPSYDPYPGNHDRWSDHLAVSPDGNDVAVTIEAYVDTNGGGPCPEDGSGQCRMDVFTALFLNAWCGPSGCTSGDITQDQMFHANSDYNPGSGLAWVDHIFPAPMMFDYDVLANSWYDFRNDPVNDADYNVYQSYFQFTYGGAVWTQQEGPPSSAGRWNPPTGKYYEIDATAMSPLHAVIPRILAADGSYNPIGVVWSPDAYLSF